MKVTALIAEDEAPQRQALRQLLASQWPELDVVAECGDGLAALTALDVHRPRVAFLDIRMPGVNGLDVAQRAYQTAHVVFTTAYDEHAVHAFETGALDYLLKPITAERLGKTILRLRERLSGSVPDIAAAIENLRQSVIVPQRNAYIPWITAAVGTVIKLFPVEEILFFKSDEKCTRVVTRREEAVIRASLKELLSALDPNAFWQIHRSVIVQVRSIRQVQRTDLGTMQVSVEGRSETLPVSQAYQHRFRGM
ncbi:MAG TPA: LytTR family DNA-binding domain-containing protein [Steroidobacteraceae bacterium]|nr:LytTR family DNA-binding domain-containing protein [Steroidobacteraceae bacterium]